MTNRLEENGAAEVIEQPQPIPPTSPDDSMLMEKQLREDRARRCTEEVNAVLKRYSCGLDAEKFITKDGRFDARPVIFPLPVN